MTFSESDNSEILSNLFREIESEIGTTDLTVNFLKSLVAAIFAFKPENQNDFCKQFEELKEVVSATEPKYGILIYNINKLFKSMSSEVCTNENFEKKIKKVIINKIRQILEEVRSHKKMIVDNAMFLDLEGKNILIHDHSHTVHSVLIRNKKQGKKFKIIIAEQDYEKTMDNVAKLFAAGISFQVIPSYMISHVQKEIDLAFFGAVTLKDSLHFVMDPGTHGIISELHLENIPCYMFIDTSKFSLWKSRKRGGIVIHKHKRKHHFKPIEYERIKYSHDRLEAKLFKKIITNKGVFTAEELKRFYTNRLKEVKEEK